MGNPRWNELRARNAAAAQINLSGSIQARVRPDTGPSNAAETGGPEADVKLKEASDAFTRLVRS